MPLSEQTLGGFKTGMTRSSRRGGKDGAQKLWTLQNGYVNDQGDVVPRPGLRHVANVAHSVGLYGADSQLHVFWGGVEGYVNPGNPLIEDHILRYPVEPSLTTFDGTLTKMRYQLVDHSDTTNYSAPGYDDSTWALGLMPLANADRPDASLVGFPAATSIYWPIEKNVWFRAKFNLTAAAIQTLYIYLDDGAEVYINGSLVFSHDHGADLHYYWVQDIPASSFVVGENTIAVKARNDIYTPNNYVAFRLAPGGDSPVSSTGLGLSHIHFAGLILGKIYTAAEFTNELVRHFFLQEPQAWKPSTIYGLNELVQPTVPNGYYYRTNTQSLAKAWAANQKKVVGDVVQPTTPNGWEYVVTDVTGDATTGESEPSWPTEDGAQVFEGTDSTTVPSDQVNPGQPTNDQISQSLKDRYGLGDNT